jgi:hypothetical protein
MAHSDDLREERRSQLIFQRLMIKGTTSLTWLLLTSFGDLKKLRQAQPTEERYVRPPRQYELAPVTPGMPVFRSRERYLRPTRYCDPCAPELVAMARSLGAYQKPDYEYVKAAFEFVKEKLPIEICPMDGVVDTLHRGTGTCFHLISLFIALCRAAGIKARYKMFAMNMIEAWRETLVDPDPLVKKWYDGLGYFVIEGEGEAFVDGRWTVAHVGPTAARQAAAGLPITRFGEDSIGLWFFPRPGTIMRFESIPLGLGRATALVHRISPGSMERINVSLEKQTERGCRVLAEAGGVAAYDERVRRGKGPRLPTLDLTPREGIVFVE